MTEETPAQVRARWRRLLRERRRKVDTDFASKAGARICANLLACDAWHGADSVALYLATDGEAPTQPIVRAAREANKCLYLPVVLDKRLEFRLWRADETLVANRYGIGEPPPGAPVIDAVELMLLPLVGWTSRGFRLGMGGGFYDRYLADPSARPAHCLGLAFECQREDSLDALRSNWDVSVDGIVTEETVYRF
ncbi:MAG: 5-formyltetrahydrofolate cyclo-ligase [Pseudomonadota bacterium]